MDYWAKPPCARNQLVLIATTVDDRIPEDHPVRLIAEILEQYDWSAWECEYNQRRGQPPIPPRILAGAWLYALQRRVRSSRQLEYMLKHAIDFMWLAEGHTPDHTTLSQFRLKFKEQLNDLFKHLLRVAWAAGYLTLVDVGTDGTRVKANNSRFETWTAERIEKAISELAAELEKQLAEIQATDRSEQEASGSDGCGDKLPAELADLKDRRQKLQTILEQLREADTARAKDGIDPKKNPAQIPKHDPDSRVLPNKEGGYAPNYTPMATTEGHGGYIVDADVIVGPNEQHDLVPSLDRIQETFGQQPEHALADSAYATGPNIVELEKRGVEFYSPLATPPTPDNPAIRTDATQPVPEADWARLPVNRQSKTLDKSCFVYDAAQDVYNCPRGEQLPYEETKTDKRHGEKVAWRVYRCEACVGCPLAQRCVSTRSPTGTRTISRDVYTEQRERHAAKMQTAEAKAIYDERMRIAETPFGFIKHVVGLRQFLLRGLERVQTEWLWTCTAVNLGKLVRDMRESCASPVQPQAVASAN